MAIFEHERDNWPNMNFFNAAADNGYVAAHGIVICACIGISWKTSSFTLGSLLLSAMQHHSAPPFLPATIVGSGAIEGGAIGCFTPFFLKNESHRDIHPRQWTKRLPRIGLCLLPLIADFIGDTIMSLTEPNSNRFFNSNRQASILGNVILTLIAVTIYIHDKYYAQRQNENPERINVTPSLSV